MARNLRFPEHSSRCLLRTFILLIRLHFCAWQHSFVVCKFSNATCVGFFALADRNFQSAQKSTDLGSAEFAVSQMRGALEPDLEFESRSHAAGTTCCARFPWTAHPDFNLLDCGSSLPRSSWLSRVPACALRRLLACNYFGGVSKWQGDGSALVCWLLRLVFALLGFLPTRKLFTEALSVQ